MMVFGDAGRAAVKMERRKLMVGNKWWVGSGKGGREDEVYVVVWLNG
jgi:hypothetical protein